MTKQVLLAVINVVPNQITRSGKDQNCSLVGLRMIFDYMANSIDPDQTTQMRRLILVLTGPIVR